ncbi:MAG: SusC/RagA family TonB-linked outer membrane protein [Bacteroidales bacterium]
MKQKLFFVLLAVFFAGTLFGQTRQLTGIVTSAADKQPIPTATVLVKGTQNGTTTGVDGRFVLSIQGQGGILVFSSIGYRKLEVPITSSNNYDISLETDVINLDEVVVTALGIRREKKALGYAVQDIGNEAINAVKPTNIVSALSGKIAGVQVTNSTGAVGSSARIVIRGNHSFGNNEPLWIVDGTPMTNFASDMSAWGGQDYGNGAMDLDPSNIESMSVLKGANAAALYGSRAANGVVVVTTKRGSQPKNKLGIDLISSVTLDNVSIFPTWQNSYGGGMYGSEYDWQLKKTELGNPNLTYQDFAKKYSYNYVDGWGNGVNDSEPRSWGPRLDIGLKLDQFTGKDQLWISRPNNMKDFFETGVNLDNSIALSKSSDIGSIRVFLSNNDIKGTVYNTDLTKNTASVSGDLKLSDKWSASANLTYVNNHSNNLPSQGYDGGGDNPAATFAMFQRQVDVVPLKEHWKEIDQFGHTYSYSLGEMDNPYLSLHNTASRTRDRFFGNASLNYKIADWITLTGRIGTDYYNELRKKIKLAQCNEGNGVGNFWQTQKFAQETNADFLAMIDKKIGEDFRIDGTVGANYRLEEGHEVGLNAYNLTVPDFFTIGNIAGTPGVSQYDSKKVTNSVLGSVNFSYKNYLFLGATGRNDWSSSLPKDSWSYFYPSVSMGFVFTDAFKIDSKIFSYGKVRASYAQVGNDTGPYQIAATYNSIGSPWNGVSMFSLPGTLPPVGLKPEIAGSVEAGLDMRFFNNRVKLDISYYDLKTRNQIMPVDIATSAGYSSMLINAGEIENKGVEVIFSASVIQSKGGFNWDLTLNWAKNNNRVNELYGDLESLWISDMWSSYIEARPGEPYGVIMGQKWLRDDQGNLVITSAGLTQNAPGNFELGNITPDWIGGLQNNFSYKGFNLGILIDGRKGGDIISGTKFWGTRFGNTSLTLNDPFTGATNVRETGIVVPGVLADGTPNTKRVTAQKFYNQYARTTEYWVMDGSFIKLRELSIGYTLPGKVAKKLGMYSARVSFVARNLALLYVDKTNDIHLDPETGFGTGNAGVGYEQMQIPSSRSLGLKLALSF